MEDEMFSKEMKYRLLVLSLSKDGEEEGRRGRMGNAVIKMRQ